MAAKIGTKWIVAIVSSLLLLLLWVGVSAFRSHRSGGTERAGEAFKNWHLGGYSLFNQTRQPVLVYITGVQMHYVTLTSDSDYTDVKIPFGMTIVAQPVTDDIPTDESWDRGRDESHVAHYLPVNDPSFKQKNWPPGKYLGWKLKDGQAGKTCVEGYYFKPMTS